MFWTTGDGLVAMPYTPDVEQFMIAAARALADSLISRHHGNRLVALELADRRR